MGMTVTIEHKHSLAIRWMHWINFPLLALMIYSGLLIYWADSQHEGLNAHRVYRVGFGSWTLFRLFPPWFYNNLHLKFQLAKGLGYHFFFMWFFALNGIAYVLYTFFSGEWRELVPHRRSFSEAILVILHDVGISTHPLHERKFNGARQVAYTGVILMGAGSLLTGLAIYKRTQLHVLTFASSTKGFASPFSVDRPTDALIPPVLLFFMTSTSAITSKTLNSCGRLQTVCQTLVIKWD
jgi:thiosulfate reductase cytochrome b subunit